MSGNLVSLKEIIFDFLKKSKENRDCSLNKFLKEHEICFETFFENLEKYGIFKHLFLQEDLEFQRISLAKQFIELGGNIETTISLLSWKEFEGLTKRVLETNGFRVWTNFRFRKKKGRLWEIDVLGEKKPFLICIDCKHWNIRRGKIAALKKAVEKQIERTKMIKEKIGELSNILDEWEGEVKIIPLLCTWLLEEIKIYKKVPIVPFFQLNSFLMNFTTYLGEIKIINAQVPPRLSEYFS